MSCAGHGATIHACTIGDDSLVGMGATVLDGSRVRQHLGSTLLSVHPQVVATSSKRAAE